jgi:hypothetical protein
MPHWKVVKNMTLFAEEVIPRLRPQAKRAERPGSNTLRTLAGAT